MSFYLKKNCEYMVRYVPNLLTISATTTIILVKYSHHSKKMQDMITTPVDNHDSVKISSNCIRASFRISK